MKNVQPTNGIGAFLELARLNLDTLIGKLLLEMCDLGFRSSVIPYDRTTELLASLAGPCNSRFTLVGDTYIPDGAKQTAEMKADGNLPMALMQSGLYPCDWSFLTVSATQDSQISWISFGSCECHL